jgi:hypothetical protein
VGEGPLGCALGVASETAGVGRAEDSAEPRGGGWGEGMGEDACLSVHSLCL